MGVPGLKKRPRGRSRGSAGNQQEQRSSSAGADSDAPDAISAHDLDRAIVPFQESQPMQQEDAAAAGAEQYAGDMEIIFNADKVSLTPLRGQQSQDTPCMHSLTYQSELLSRDTLPSIIRCWLFKDGRDVLTACRQQILLSACQ